MAVKKKMNQSIENFIDKGADVKATKDKSFKNVLVRVPSEILKELDKSLDGKPWLSRTRWIVEAIHTKLKFDVEEEAKEIVR